ncbi:MAG: bifunctional precorrin-2 dehydrogenase/sirohydrochlorin ferrochelatase [Acidobacteria bacterium]|nr:bifunctional precorrin-2 dehydrogenase/sirohydrochlorin ferrochelatase [Acidobacteriota bacterium]
MDSGFPITLDLRGKRCLVLGTGEAADGKALALEACGASVFRLPEYRPGCLEGFFLAVAAGLDRSPNAEIFVEGERSGVLVNCVDDPPHCRFIFPALLRRGELTVAVSTGGACPALAVRLRERMEREFGPEYGEFLELARSLREPLARSVPEFDQRRRLWYALVDSEILGLLRDGRREEAFQMAKALMPPDALR